MSSKVAMTRASPPPPSSSLLPHQNTTLRAQGARNTATATLTGKTRSPSHSTLTSSLSSPSVSLSSTLNASSSTSSAALPSTFVDLKSKSAGSSSFGASAFSHYKYNFLSAGGIQQQNKQVRGNNRVNETRTSHETNTNTNTNSTSASSTFTTSITTNNGADIKAAGLGFGNKHNDHFLYLSQSALRDRSTTHGLSADLHPQQYPTARPYSSSYSSSSSIDQQSLETRPGTSATGSGAMGEEEKEAEAQKYYRRSIAGSIGFGRKHKYYSAYLGSSSWVE